MSLRIAEFLCETKINDIELVVTALPNDHKEIIRLDIAVDEITRVNVLNTRDLIETMRKRTRI
jgi:hypothetical protein